MLPQTVYEILRLKHEFSQAYVSLPTNGLCSKRYPFENFTCHFTCEKHEFGTLSHVKFSFYICNGNLRVRLSGLCNWKHIVWTVFLLRILFFSLGILQFFLHSLDIQTTMTIDHRLEASRQNMFVSAFSRVVGNLRRKRDISEGQSKLVWP